VDATKKQQVVAARGAGREFLQINAVVNGGRVVEIRVAVGGADGHQVADVVVYTVDRQDALGEKPWMVVTSGAAASRA